MSGVKPFMSPANSPWAFALEGQMPTVNRPVFCGEGKRGLPFYWNDTGLAVSVLAWTTVRTGSDRTLFRAHSFARQLKGEWHDWVECLRKTFSLDPAGPYRWDSVAFGAPDPGAPGVRTLGCTLGGRTARVLRGSAAR